MDQSDFDLLCAGASAEETRRLSKMLLDWSDGDQNGFPAQIALLTRAQFRVASGVPRLLSEAREGLRQEFNVQQKQIAAQVNSYSSVTTARIGELEKLLKEERSQTAKATAAIRGESEQAQAVAKQLRAELEAGARTWKVAQSDFEKAARRLNQVTCDLEARPWRSHWVLVTLLLLAAAGLGFCAARLKS